MDFKHIFYIYHNTIFGIGIHILTAVHTFDKDMSFEVVEAVDIAVGEDRGMVVEGIAVVAAVFEARV